MAMELSKANGEHDRIASKDRARGSRLGRHYPPGGPLRNYAARMLEQTFHFRKLMRIQDVLMRSPGELAGTENARSETVDGVRTSPSSFAHCTLSCWPQSPHSEAPISADSSVLAMIEPVVGRNRCEALLGPGGLSETISISGEGEDPRNVTPTRHRAWMLAALLAMALAYLVSLYLLSTRWYSIAPSKEFKSAKESSSRRTRMRAPIHADVSRGDVQATDAPAYPLSPDVISQLPPGA
ncbi:MAG: hypothetical protein U1D30_21460 [Planctomycetota bacterium]